MLARSQMPTDHMCMHADKVPRIIVIGPLHIFVHDLLFLLFIHNLIDSYTFMIILYIQVNHLSVEV